MKKTRKLVPAIALLMVSVLMLSTASYAWFSMNTKVTATDMQVKVKSNATFLLISSEKTTAADIQGEKLITVALPVEAEDAAVYPAKPMEASEIGAGKLFADGTPVTDKATAAVPANWYTANSTDPGASTTDVQNQTALTAENFTNYVIKKTVYLTLAEGATKSNNLTVTPTITAQAGTATDISAVKVLVATSDGGFAILDSTMSAAQDIKGANTDLTDAAVVTVDIYIYYDGSEDAVYTNNIADLAGANISLEFGVTVNEN